MGWADALERLETRLPTASLELIEWFAERCDASERVLWVDAPWHELDYDAFAIGDEASPIALAVFVAPLEDGSLTLSAEHLLGDFSEREERAFVFLSQVEAEALTTLPSTVAIFAGGLAVEGAACLAAEDASTHVASHLRAGQLFCGGAEGELKILPNTDIRVELLAGGYGGTQSPSEALPFLAETIEDDSVVSACWELQHGHCEVPADFEWPAGYKPPFDITGYSEAFEVLEPDAYREWVDSHERMSIEGKQLLQGMHDVLMEGGHGARLVSVLPDDIGAVPEEVIIVREAVSQKAALALRSGGEGWRAYIFLKTVKCGDLTLEHNVLASFRDGLKARIVATVPSDTHLFVSGTLDASVLCGTAYIRRRSGVQLGTLAGAVCRFVDQAELVPEWADELEAGTALWWLFAQAFAEQEDEGVEGFEEVEPERTALSAYEIEWDDALARLAQAGLHRTCLQALEHTTRFIRETTLVLWIDTPWAEVDYADLATDIPVGLTVFAAPFKCEGSLSLSGEELIGDGNPLDGRAYVFLDKASAFGMSTLPDILTIFAGGLSLHTAGCFSAADATTFVGSHLRAPCVVSGAGDGGIVLVGKVNMAIETLVGGFEGAPRKAANRSVDDAYARWADDLEDGTRLWELFCEAFANGESVEPE